VDRPSRELVVNVGAPADTRALHEVLARELDFPRHYGRNWDAFTDCLRDLEGRPRIRVLGWAALAATLPRDAVHLRSCLEHGVAEGCIAGFDLDAGSPMA
jgi:hypothetical protein